jgi:type II secretory pathway pseudopilin PulG
MPSEQAGTLLLDTLTAIVILAVIFACVFPNYQRAALEGNIALEAQQLQQQAAAATLYANDQHGVFPTVPGYQPVASTLGTEFLPIVPAPAIGGGGSFDFAPTPENGASFEIVDTNALTNSGAYEASLFSAYTRADQSACTAGDFFAIDNVDGVHCAPGN